MTAMKTIYRNARIVTDGRVTEGLDVVAENGKIAALVPTGTANKGTVIDLKGKYLASGFIDIHCHGGGGYEFVDGTEESVIKAAAVHAAHGTRVMFPTISASDFDVTYRALEAIEKAKDKCALQIAGVHLEGPYLNPVMCGGQAGDALRLPDEKEYSALAERFGSLISRWTYAPEMDADNRFLKFIIATGIVPSAGHTDAVWDDMSRALAGGCRLVTHLYSCTSTVTRQGGFRRLGVIESAYLCDDIAVEAIGDGRHLPHELLRLIIKLKGPEKVCLITDAIRFGGAGKDMEGKVYTDCPVPFVIEDGVAKLPDRSAFAGSIATMERLLQEAVKAGIPLGDTVRMLTETPAKVMGLADKGRIAEGYDADFTVFDGDNTVCAL